MMFRGQANALKNHTENKYESESIWISCTEFASFDLRVGITVCITFAKKQVGIISMNNSLSWYLAAVEHAVCH